MVTIIRITVDTGMEIFSFFHVVDLHGLSATGDGVIQLKKNPTEENRKQVLFSAGFHWISSCTR